MNLEMSNLQIDPAGTRISDKARAFINIEADLRILICGRIFFDEPMICVVELADAISNWLSLGEGRLPDFRYESMDDDEPNILCLRVSGDETEITSAWQKFDVAEPLDTEKTIARLKKFVDEVVAQCRNTLGLEVRGWIRGYGLGGATNE